MPRAEWRDIHAEKQTDIERQRDTGETEGPRAEQGKSFHIQKWLQPCYS